MRTGKFITIEGGEGVGKSTQIEAVRQTVLGAGLRAVMTREPGGTTRAERIRELLLTPTEESMPPTTELLLMFAARGMHIDNLIRPALERGDWVICDRFTDATYAYQGAGRAMPKEHIAYLESWVQGDLRPDLTLLLDAPLELAMARARQRNAERGLAGGDRFEREQRDFFERVRAAYLKIAREEPNRVAVVDASLPIEQVQSQVQTLTTHFIERSRNQP